MASFATVRQVLEQAVADRSCPGAVLEVGSPSDVLFRSSVGSLTYEPEAPRVRDDTVFDLASLTKVIATSSLAMREVERGVLALTDRVSDHIHAWTGGDRSRTTVEDLLAHCSGLPAYRPLFKDHGGRAAFEAAISVTPLGYPPRSQSIYSDLGFMLLGFMLDAGPSLRERFDVMWTQMATGEELQFLPPALWRPRTAPTEFDPWRGRLLVGEVHDENAAALGGVAGHAGLFGTAPAVGAFARHVLQVLDGRAGAFARSSVHRFVSRRADIPGSSRALGWDTMVSTSSCGTRMSPRAFGHTGFTGTSLWMDPERGVYVVLLSNRVYPTRENDGIQHVRRVVHDAVMDALGPS